MLLIRPIEPKDLEKVVELTNEAYTIPYRPGKKTTHAHDTLAKIEADLRDGGMIFVAELEGEIVGAVRCQESAGTILLFKLAVAGDFRQQGIGGKLIETVFQYAKDQNIPQVKIEVMEEKGLIPYYESFGFVVTGKQFVRDHDEVIMVKDLLKR